MILVFVFFFNDTATTEIYTLSLHDALPIYRLRDASTRVEASRGNSPHSAFLLPCSCPLASQGVPPHLPLPHKGRRSEEHTSELQSRQYLVCRLLLEKKKKYNSLLLSYIIDL